MVDPETLASQKRICLTEFVPYIDLSFHNDSTIKDKSKQNIMIFCHDKAYKIKFRFGVYAFQDAALCSSTS
jgi:hypothetical protein